MAFFTPHFTTTSENFGPFLNLFDGPSFHRPTPTISSSHPFAAYMTPSQRSSPAVCYRPGSIFATRKPTPTFQPKFDVRETDDAYYLHGELAGLNKENVVIEFTDPQTMMIRGRVERNYSKGVPVQAQAQAETRETRRINANSTEKSTEKSTETTPTEAPVEAAPTTGTPDPATEPMEVDTIDKPTEDTDKHSDTASHKYQPTVEDTPDEDDRFSVTSMSSTHSHSSAASAAAAKAEATVKTKIAADKVVTEKAEREAAEKLTKERVDQVATVGKGKEASRQQDHEQEQVKFWVQERSIGEFSRTFEFPRLIRQQEVHASLDDGVLTVVVPKARMESRRVIIF